MQDRPRPVWTEIEGERYWGVDWREFFGGHLSFWEPRLSGEMRGFHVILRVRINVSGTLVVRDGHGSRIRRDSEVVHDRTSVRSQESDTIEVTAGDCLEVAQWQLEGGSMFAARMARTDTSLERSASVLAPYLAAVERRLRAPNGPPLKMYFSGETPIRTVIALYSLILNGYSPASVQIFGEEQWTGESRALFESLLPFSTIVPRDDVLRRAEAAGGRQLVELAQQDWLVTKACVALLCSPSEFCYMDDDVYILDDMRDAIDAFRDHALVFGPDADYSEDYLRAWRFLYDSDEPLPTGRFNGGLYLLKSVRDAETIGRAMLHTPLDVLPSWQWEQGFMACLYGREATYALQSRRYFYPYFDGLPGGVRHYDYAANPCGFVSIHFGGLAVKPGDADALVVARQILGRRAGRTSPDPS